MNTNVALYSIFWISGLYCLWNREKYRQIHRQQRQDEIALIKKRNNQKHVHICRCQPQCILPPHEQQDIQVGPYDYYPHHRYRQRCIGRY